MLIRPAAKCCLYEQHYLCEFFLCFLYCIILRIVYYETTADSCRAAAAACLRAAAAACLRAAAACLRAAAAAC